MKNGTRLSDKAIILQSSNNWMYKFMQRNKLTKNKLSDKEDKEPE